MKAILIFSVLMTLAVFLSFFRIGTVELCSLLFAGSFIGMLLVLAIQVSKKREEY